MMPTPLVDAVYDATKLREYFEDILLREPVPSSTKAVKLYCSLPCSPDTYWLARLITSSKVANVPGKMASNNDIYAPRPINELLETTNYTAKWLTCNLSSRIRLSRN